MNRLIIMLSVVLFLWLSGIAAIGFRAYVGPYSTSAALEKSVSSTACQEAVDRRRTAERLMLVTGEGESGGVTRAADVSARAGTSVDALARQFEEAGNDVQANCWGLR